MERRTLIRSLLVTGAGVTLQCSLREIWKLSAGKYEAGEELKALTEAIIPTTDTPGAIEAGVPEFIMSAIHKTSVDHYAKSFIQDLKDCMEQCKTEYSWTFQYLSQDQKHNFLSSLAEREDPFYRTLHTWTLIGYFTSEVGMTRALNYDPIPGRYDPCLEVTTQTRGEAIYF